MPVHEVANVPIAPQQSVGEKIITQLIAEHVRARPQQRALVSEDAQLSYADLDRRSARLANHLRSLGVGRETLAAICLERAPEFVVAALAIMRCGAAYLPLDPSNPPERLRFIAKDADVRVVVTRQDYANHFRDLEIVTVDGEDEAIRRAPEKFADIAIDPADLAYVIYTSGSTGEPKGVEITHGNLANLISWHVRAFNVDQNDRATFQAGIGFDAAVWEIWPHLATGAALYLPNELTRLSAKDLRNWMVEQKITISFVPTAMAEQLMALSWPNETKLRFLLTGADTLHRHPKAGLPFALVNNYGPTECTVVATSGIVPADGNSEMLPTIGRPIDHVQLYIADEQLREVANGTIGEILIGGAGVARGYRNRPELTTERFVEDPFCGRVYRTGDLGRWRETGEIEFHGRIDDQVKIRGYRIELGEINSVLNKHPSVRASVVVAREDLPGEKRLVAYVVPVAGASRDEGSLRATLQEKLPDYMKPSAFVWMESFPLTANGKIDRAALPAPKAEVRASEFIAPQSPTEKALAAIICEFLKLERVSVHDDFFQLGAHSLLGAQILARVRAVFGADLKLLDVFDAPTVAQLAVKIEEALTVQLGQMSDADVIAALAASKADSKTQ